MTKNEGDNRKGKNEQENIDRKNNIRVRDKYDLKETGYRGESHKEKSLKK
jgi:hypothetical protein